MDFRSVIARTITRVERPRNEHDLVVSTALGRRGLIVGIFHGSFLLYLINGLIKRISFRVDRIFCDICVHRYDMNDYVCKLSV